MPSESLVLDDEAKHATHRKRNDKATAGQEQISEARRIEGF